MIGYLEGLVRGRVVLTTTGVGYVVNTPRPLVEGSTARLHVATVVREDAITLYGFVEESERCVFEALCKVTGVGANSALSVLRDAGVSAVASAVAAKDPSRLGRIKGVGPKTAARIVSDLRLPDGVTPGDDLPIDTELVATLVGLGFERSSALEAIASAPAGVAEQDVLSSALAHLRAGAR